jgi:hypothetical protein
MVSRFTNFSVELLRRWVIDDPAKELMRVVLFVMSENSCIYGSVIAGQRPAW